MNSQDGKRPGELRIELGGGDNPVGKGFINFDRIESADRIIDFETDPLPYGDSEVDHVYSAHCLEHVVNHHQVLIEILRVCKIGAKVQLRFPHWMHPLAMSSDHKFIASDRQVKLWCEQPERYWPREMEKRFKLNRIHYEPEVDFYVLRQKKCFSDWEDGEIKRLLPSACHEVHYHMEVEPWK